MNKKIAAVLKKLAEVDEGKKKLEVVYKSGKDSVRQSFEGKNRYLDALKEVLKNL